MFLVLSLQLLKSVTQVLFCLKTHTKSDTGKFNANYLKVAVILVLLLLDDAVVFNQLLMHLVNPEGDFMKSFLKTT